MSDRVTTDPNKKHELGHVSRCTKPETLLFRQDNFDGSILFALEPRDEVRTKGSK